MPNGDRLYEARPRSEAVPRRAPQLSTQDGFLCYCSTALLCREIHVLRQIAAVRRGRSKMENISGFRWTFACATMGLAISVSLCFAQGDRDVSQEPQRLQEAQRLLGPCDSLDPKVCFDIYQRRMKQLPERKPDLGWLSRDYGQAMVGKWLSPSFNLPSRELRELGTRVR
jgi:hypothetical protein